MEDNSTVDVTASDGLRNEQAISQSSDEPRDSRHVQSDEPRDSHRIQSASDVVNDEADVSHGGRAERGSSSFRGRSRRAPRRFGGWQGNRRPAGTYNRLARGHKPSGETNMANFQAPVLPTPIDDVKATGEMQNETPEHTSTRETRELDSDERSSLAQSTDVLELVCEPGSSGVRTVEMALNSLTVRINYTSSDDAKQPEPQTQRGFRVRGFRSQRRGRGRISVADSRESATEDHTDRGSDFNCSSDLRTGVTGDRRFDEEEQVRADRGARRARRRWQGSGWRRGGAGRYFRQRYGERPETRSDPRPRDGESAELISDDDIASRTASATSAALNQDSNPLSVDTSVEQSSASTLAESVTVVSVDVDRGSLKNAYGRGVPLDNRRAQNRQYVFRRSSAGRFNRASFAGRDATRRTDFPWQPVTTEVKTSTVPCSVSNDYVEEDWDAECVPVEPPTDNDRLGVETESDTTAVQTTVNSSDDLETDVHRVHDSS